MFARICLLLLALHLLAAPVGDVIAEAADTVSYAAVADDDPATKATGFTLAEPPPRAVPVPRAADTTRPTPTLARVFRPPRPAFD